MISESKRNRPRIIQFSALLLCLAASTYSNISAAESFGRGVGHLYSFNGFQFSVLPNDGRQAYNVNYATIEGQEWLRFEAHRGDNNAGDVNLDRVGIDGYPQPGGLLDAFELSFEVIPAQNSDASGGDWWNILGIHARKHPSYQREYEGPGPLSFTNEAGLFRIWRRFPRNVPVAGALLSPKDFDQEVIYQGPALRAGQIYLFRLEARRSDTNGYVRVYLSINGGTAERLVNYQGQFGYGGARDLYPSFRIYRNARSAVQVAYYRLVDITRHHIR